MYKESGKQIRDRFLRGDVSAEEICRYFLKRIESYDGQVGAFLNVFKKRAMDKAKTLDEKKRRGEKLGRLAAIPVGLKDNIHVRDELTTCASKFLTNYRAVFDATVTELLEEEDALIMGKLNLDEFAMGSSNENSALQKTFNPWHLECVPGGSSGGSAAAVAARLVPMSFGSDTGGSVRQPAALCGVVGFKPTYGRISRYGLVAFGSSLDQIGPMATTTEDIALLMEVLGRRDPNDATTLEGHGEDYPLDGSLKGKKVGVPWDFLKNLHAEPKECFERSIQTLKELGCEIVDIDLSILKYAIGTYYIIATAEASTNLARFDGVRYGMRSPNAKTLEEVYNLSRTEGFGPEVRNRIMLGTYVLSSGYQDCYYKQAAKVRVKITDQFNAAFEQCDMIATPVSPIACFPAGAIQDPLEMYLQDIFTIGVNLARLPAISVPCGFNPEKKPFGLHLIGAKRADRAVCHMAHQFEKKALYNLEIPPLFDKE